MYHHRDPEESRRKEGRKRGISSLSKHHIRIQKENAKHCPHNTPSGFKEINNIKKRKITPYFSGGGRNKRNAVGNKHFAVIRVGGRIVELRL